MPADNKRLSGRKKADNAVGPFVRIHRTASFAVTLQLCLRRPTFSVAPEKVGKKKRLGTRYIARSRARFIFNALFGRKANTLPIVYGSDECTTRICGQTASISFLLISGILGRLRCYTAYRVLAAIFFYGLILWHCGTIRFASGVSFCILFLTRQTEPNCKPAKRLQFGEDEQRNGRDLPLAAGRGMWSL